MKADMRANTVTVTFDDEKVEIAAIVDALYDAGYVVKGQQKLN